jgi:hypothetical protein
MLVSSPPRARWVAFSLLSLGAHPVVAAPADATPVATPSAASEAAAPSATEASAAASSFEELEATLASDSAVAGSAAPPPPPTAPGGTASMNPDISAILDFALAWFSDEDPPQSGHHDPHRTGFNWQGLELTLGSNVDPYFRFDGHLGFSPEGVEVEEAYVTTLALPGSLQARFGKFLTRFGRSNATHPHTWNFADQPFELGRLFGGEGLGGLGAELSLVLPVPWSVELVGAAGEASGEGSARSFLGEQERPMKSLLEPVYSAAIRQFFPVSGDWSLAWGLSGAFGPNAAGDHTRTEIYGSDLYLKFRPLRGADPRVFSLLTEWFYRRRQLPGTVLEDYGQLTEGLWQFALRWAVAARYELGSPAFDGAEVVIDPLDPDWLDTRYRVSASLSFWPTERSRFRWQAACDLPGQARVVGSTFLTAEVSVGAHGAHTF